MPSTDVEATAVSDCQPIGKISRSVVRGLDRGTESQYVARVEGPERTGGSIRLARRGDVQGLRGIAVLVVVFFHARWGFSGGYVGVDVFFVISGFVITRMLVAELTPTSSIDFGRFYARRVRRLLPALATVLVATMLLAIVLTPIRAQAYTEYTGVAAALFNANTYLAFFSKFSGYFATGVELNPLLHMWSLSVEEQFYLVFPALLLAAWKSGRRRGADLKAVGVLLVAITVVSATLGLLMSFGAFGSVNLAFYLAPARAWEFAVGGLVAVVAFRRRPGALHAEIAGVSGLVLIAIAVFAFDSRTLFPGVAVVVPVLGAMAVVWAGCGDRESRASRCLSWRPMQFLGDISYSWYLWHWPFIAFAGAVWPDRSMIRPIAALVSLAPSLLSYVQVERRFRLGSGRERVRAVTLAVTCAMVPLAAAGVLQVGTSYVVDQPDVAAFSDHLDRWAGCEGEQVEIESAERCQFNVDGRAGTAVLVGDSNAGQLAEAFVTATGELDVRSSIATFNDCPFVELSVFDRGGRNEACDQHNAAVRDAVLHLRPSLLIVSDASDVYVRVDRWSLLDPNDPAVAPTTDTAAKADLWARALRATVEEFEAVGVQVVVVHPVPKFDRVWNPVTESPVRILGPASWLQIRMSSADAVDHRALAVAAEDAATLDTGAVVVDYFDLICPDETCAAFRDGMWWYHDWQHISVAASQLLTEPLRSDLARALA
jgi:peptidoglycan/LPS O-acetylase OafA/YrhL